MDADKMLEALVAIRDAKSTLTAAERAIADAIVQLGDRHDIEGRDLGRMSAPGDVVVACATHPYAPPQHVAPFCAQDEPPSRPAP